MKTIVIEGDYHCGSVYGLTPPNYWTKGKKGHYRAQKEAWSERKRITRKWGPPDLLVLNGDLIDGTQAKSGGAELITTDRNIQIAMAVECAKAWKAKKILMTFGTAYHVGNQAEDFEYNAKQLLTARIEGRLYFTVEGMTFDVRHKIGTSGIPHGRATPLLKELMWDLIKEAEGTGPHVDVIIRSHAHYHLWVETATKTMMILPALQLSRGRFGSRECSGETHWGMIQLTVHKGQIVDRKRHIWNLRADKPRVLKIGS